jgi:hypothetical protein
MQADAGGDAGKSFVCSTASLRGKKKLKTSEKLKKD